MTREEALNELAEALKMDPAKLERILHILTTHRHFIGIDHNFAQFTSRQAAADDFG